MSANNNEIIAFLKELDSQVRLVKPIELFLIGGAAITLNYDPANRTSDLDFIEAPLLLVKLGAKTTALAKRYHVYISSLAEINFSAPKDWRSKCEDLPIKFRHFTIKIPCVEDIVLGKVGRMEPKDFEDIIELKQQKKIKPLALLKRLNQNLKELKNIEYRNNAKMLFSEIFGKDLIFKNGKCMIK